MIYIIAAIAVLPLSTAGIVVLMRIKAKLNKVDLFTDKNQHSRNILMKAPLQFPIYSNNLFYQHNQFI